MKTTLTLAAALLAGAALSQELKKFEPPVRVGAPAVKEKDTLKIAIPAPIAFSRTGAQKGIWKQNTDRTETRLTTGEDSSPASYNDGRIFFVRRESGQSNVWSMKRDGTQAHREVSNAYSPQPFAGLLAFLRRDSGDLGKVWLMLLIDNEVKKVASAGWVARGYYISRPVFEPGTSRILAGIYEKDDGGARPKVRVRAFNFDGTYNELWSGVAGGVSGLAAYRDDSGVHRLGVLTPEGGSADLWRLDGGSGSAQLVADPDAETSLDAMATGRLLIGAGGKLYVASKTGTGRIFVADGSDGIWLD